MKLLIYPHPFLRKKTKKVKEISKILSSIEEMKKIILASQALGLSANQVGLNYSFFIAFYQKKFYVLINPKILKRSKEKSFDFEGCLSLPEIVARVNRPQAVVIEALNQEGKKIRLKAQGTLARIFLHEYDHLNGILIIDRSKEIYKITPQAKI